MARHNTKALTVTFGGLLDSSYATVLAGFWHLRAHRVSARRQCGRSLASTWAARPACLEVDARWVWIGAQSF